MRRFIILFSLILLVSMFLTACAPGTNNHTPELPAGFLWGIWHGWIAPVSLIWHFFNPAVRIYETNNNGGWYDFGFYIAIIGGFGSIAFSRRKRKP